MVLDLLALAVGIVLAVKVYKAFTKKDDTPTFRDGPISLGTGGSGSTDDEAI